MKPVVRRLPRQRHVLIAALLLALGPLVLKPAIGPFEPTWGGHVPATWAVLILLAFGVVAFSGGLLLIARSRPAGNRASYYVGAAFGTLVAIVPVGLALFWSVNVFAIFLALPYAIGSVGLVAWLRRS